MGIVPGIMNAWKPKIPGFFPCWAHYPVLNNDGHLDHALPQNSVQVCETRVSGWIAGTSPLVTFFRLFFFLNYLFLFFFFILIFFLSFFDILYILFGDLNHVDHDHGDLHHDELKHGDYNHGELDHGDCYHGDLRHGDLHHGVLDHGDPGELW